MAEVLDGYDCSYFHFGTRSPAHTLKCLVLDTTRRTAPLTLAEVREAIEPRLALHPRARQRAVRAALPGRHVWCDDPDFALDRHLGQVELESPSGFDRLCGRLASEPLPLDRPLWHATLVHGLDKARQAIVLRVHHSVMDGIAAANTLRRFTTEFRDETVSSAPDAPWDPADIPSERELRRRALAAVPSWGRRLATYGRETVRTRGERRRDTRLVRDREDLIGFRSEATYGWTGARFGGRRTCAHGSLPLETFRAIKDRHGVTVNDVLVAITGEAVAMEARARREHPRAEDEIALFSIALDTDPDRLSGNRIMAIAVPMHTRGDDLTHRLEAISRTNRDQIALTRRQQERRSVRITDLWARSYAIGARAFAYRIPTMVANVVMANVPGSPTTRWMGDVDIVDFVSYAVLVQPIGVNLTVYSYDGRMSIGLLTAPEVIDDPYRLLGHMETALDRFATA